MGPENPKFINRNSLDEVRQTYDHGHDRHGKLSNEIGIFQQCEMSLSWAT